MNAWLVRVRWWQVGLLAALPLGVVFALMSRFVRDHSWSEALVSGLFTGLLCGGIVGVMVSSRLREDVGDMPVETYERVERATRRGPVPADPEERAAAHELLVSRLVAVRAQRTPGTVVLGVLAVITAVGAVTRSPWWWAVTGSCAALLVLVLAIPGRMERRAQLLAGPDRPESTYPR